MDLPQDDTMSNASDWKARLASLEASTAHSDEAREKAEKECDEAWYQCEKAKKKNKVGHLKDGQLIVQELLRKYAKLEETLNDQKDKVNRAEGGLFLLNSIILTLPEIDSGRKEALSQNRELLARLHDVSFVFSVLFFLDKKIK